MRITKIQIQNFKSIKDMIFNIDKYGDSYTAMLVGVNESGKSNILQAMSYLIRLQKSLIILDLHNQKDDENTPVDLWFYLEFDNDKTIETEIVKN